MPVRQIYYYGKNAQESNRSVTSVPILINDTGEEVYSAPFRSSSSRKDFGLVYVLRGEIIFTDHKGKRVAKAGDFIISPPHEERIGFGTDGDFLNYYWLNFSGSGAKKLVEEMGFQYRTVYHIGGREEISECFRRIFREFQRQDRFFVKRSEAAFVMLLSTIARRMEGVIIPISNRWSISISTTTRTSRLQLLQRWKNSVILGTMIYLNRPWGCPHENILSPSGFIPPAVTLWKAPTPLGKLRNW